MTRWRRRALWRPMIRKCVECGKVTPSEFHFHCASCIRGEKKLTESLKRGKIRKPPISRRLPMLPVRY